MGHNREAEPLRISLNTQCLNNPRTTVTVWLCLCVLLGIVGVIIETRTVLPGPTNLHALFENAGERAAYSAGIPLRDTLIVVLESNHHSTADPKFLEARDALVQLLKELRAPGDAESIFDRVETAGYTIRGDEYFISANNRALLLRAEARSSIDRSADKLRGIPEALEEWRRRHHDFSLHYLSDGTVNNEMFDLIDADLHHSLIYTLPITFVILLLAFRSLAAACIPLLIAALSLVASLGLSALSSQIDGPISATASQLVVLLVLAIGIDYSLFLISRVREERHGGRTVRDAVLVAAEATGMAILWSGVIVAASLCGLFLMRDTVLASMALVSVISVIVTVLSAVFVLPSILLLLGERMEWGRLSLSLWGRGCVHVPFRWLSTAMTYPLRTTMLSVIGLMAVGAFTTQMKLGSTVEPLLLPQSLQSHHAYEALRTAFPNLDGVDFTIAFWGDSLPEAEESDSFQELLDHIAAIDGVQGPIAIDRSEDGQVARYHFIALGSSNAPRNRDLVHMLRNELLPQAMGTLGVHYALGGILPFVVDDIDRYSERTPQVFGAVLALSFVFLLLAFRSLAIPLKAMGLNILSTLAAFGTLVLVFQFSGIERLNTPVIESFVPALLFAILFGLSMDYHVFLLSRVTEEYRAGHPIELAVRLGIERTFGTITSAALIMVSVFLVIACLELPIMRQLGFGLAVAVIIDATLIRCLILPSTMLLLGRWNWYLPCWLSRLPRINIH